MTVDLSKQASSHLVDDATTAWLDAVARTAEAIARRVLHGSFAAVWRREDGAVICEHATTKAQAGGSVPDDCYNAAAWLVFERVEGKWYVVDWPNSGCVDEACLCALVAALQGR